MEEEDLDMVDDLFNSIDDDKSARIGIGYGVWSRITGYVLGRLRWLGCFECFLSISECIFWPFTFMKISIFFYSVDFV